MRTTPLKAFSKTPLKQKKTKMRLADVSGGISDGGLQGGGTARLTHTFPKQITLTAEKNISAAYDKNKKLKLNYGGGGGLNVKKQWKHGSISGGVSFNPGDKNTYNISLVKTFGSKKK